MKQVLVTGESSYIGNSFKKWVEKNNKNLDIKFISLKNNNWRDRDFSKYDVVLHLAGLVHKKEKQFSYEEYDRVNYELTKNLFEVCHSNSVDQFIFMSTFSVYGKESSLDEISIINKKTKENPTTFYGKSKLKAENYLISNKKSTSLSIVRPPMVYGEDCTGNYKALKKISLISPVFPYIENKRSVVNINKLCFEIFNIINEKRDGVFIVQDEDFMNTSLEVKKIAELSGKKIYLSRFLGDLLIKLGKKNKTINKVFGSLIYQDKK